MLSLDLAYRRGGFHLRVQHRFERGVNGICGPSGAGKSTLLALVAGLLRPQSGSIVFDEGPLSDAATNLFVPAHRRHFGLVFQDGQLFPHLSVQANLLYGWKQLRESERRLQLDAVADLLELRPLLQRRTQQLSGGERQRVALGRALLYSPRLLLLDEPLAALDPRLKQQILPFLKRVRDETGIPMLYVSHAREELEYLADRIVQIEDGELKVDALRPSTALRTGLSTLRY